MYMSRYNCCQPVQCCVVRCESSCKEKKHCKKRRHRKCESSSSSSSDCESSSSSSSEEQQILYNVRNLVSNVTGRAPNVDPNAVNSWGIVHTGNQLWVAQNGTGVISNYNINGVEIPPAIIVPSTEGPGSPTGLVLNPGPNFLISGLPAKLLAATEDGLIVAYNATVNPTNAITVVDRSGVDANYKGLAVTNTNIYAADFHNNRIDTFDSAFNLLGGFPFVDPTIPAGYAPFNIVYLHGKLYVLYAQQDGAAENDVAAPGNGYVSIFTTAGVFVKRFISRGYLNSPWALIAAPHDCGFEHGYILVGNNGDGTIGVYDRNGTFMGRLEDCACQDIIIDGLWGITNTLYFASGPNNEENGLVGRLCRC